MPRYKDFDDVARSLPAVAFGIKAGVPLELIIVALANMIEGLKARNTKLELIAPFKIRTPDGTVLIYRCPDENVPMRDLSDPDEDGERPNLGDIVHS